MLNILLTHSSWMPPEYANIKIPEDLAKLIEKLISEHKELGYRNRSEFIIEAVREKILSLEGKK